VNNKHHTEETKEKLRIAGLKNWQNEDYRKYMIKANLGKHYSEETKEKKGKPLRVKIILCMVKNIPLKPDKK